MGRGRTPVAVRVVGRCSTRTGAFRCALLAAAALCAAVLSGCATNESASCRTTFGGGVECEREESFVLIEWAKANPFAALVIGIAAFALLSAAWEGLTGTGQGPSAGPRPTHAPPRPSPSYALDHPAAAPQAVEHVQLMPGRLYAFDIPFVPKYHPRFFVTRPPLHPNGHPNLLFYVGHPRDARRFVTTICRSAGLSASGEGDLLVVARSAAQSVQPARRLVTYYHPTEMADEHGTSATGIHVYGTDHDLLCRLRELIRSDPRTVLVE
mgnify:CR=1 FL=1